MAVDVIVTVNCSTCNFAVKPSAFPRERAERLCVTINNLNGSKAIFTKDGSRLKVVGPCHKCVAK